MFVRERTLLFPVAVAALLCQTVAVAAQSADESPGFVHRSWTAEDGLPQNTVTAIARTTDGYVWLGTVKGVVRFDGVRFVAFERATTPGLADDRVTQLLATASGDLWIGTEWGGVGLHSKGMFTSYLGDGGVSEHYISSLFEDRYGNVWIGAPKVAYRYDGESFVRFQFAAPDSPDSPRSFLETRDGRLLVSGQGVYQFTGDGFRAVEMHGLEVGTVVYDMHEAEGGSLWLATSKGIVHSTPTRSRTYAFGSEPVTVLAVGNDGLLWAGVRGQGLVRFNGEGWAIERRLGFIRHLYPDEDGLLWVAGGDDGLHRLQPTLFRTIAEIGAPGGESVLRVVEDNDGGIWTGSLYAGLFRFTDGNLLRFTSENGLPTNASFIIAEDPDGGIWSATGSMLFRLNGERITPVDLGADANPYGSTTIRAIVASSAGGLWLGMPGLIARFDGRGLSDQVALPEHRGINHTHLHEDSAGNVWISADRGRLCRISSGVPTCLGREEGIPPHVVRDVHENPDGSYWFGTYGGGLCHLVHDRARCIGPEEGLPDNTVHEIFDDEYGYVWFSSNRGVSRVKRSDLEAVFRGASRRIVPDTYGPSDGMPSSECNEGGVQASDGTLWFPTMRGLTYVDPKDALTYRTGAARTYVEGLVVDGLSVGLVEEPILAPGSDRLTFEFTGVYFNAPDKLRFRSRLVGHDDDWIASGSDRSATYTNLAPGSYEFEVQSAVGSGDWSEPATARVTIEPFFYQTWTFRFLVVLCLLGLLTLTYRRRVGRLLVQERLRLTEAEAKRLAELDAAKSRFFANVSHEFRTPLTLIISPVTDALEKDGLSNDDRRRYKLILSNAQRLLRLINQLLDLSRLDAGRFKLERSDSELVSFIAGLVRSFQPLAERTGISLKFRTQLSARSVMFDANVMSGIVNNLLSNALKFTPSGGKVWVTLAERDDGVFEIVVKDTGPGIPKNALPRIFDRFEQVDRIVGSDSFGSGIGLALAKELAELHGGILLVESEEGFGSAFIVRLKLAAAETGAVASRIELLDPPGYDDGTDVIEDVTAVPESAENHPTVLVVDDNPEIRSLVVDLLGSSFNIVEASDGEEGIRAALEYEPELVVTDLMMPGLDGIGLCRRIRSEARLKHVAIILLTARADDESTLEGLAAGADDYIVKPFHAATLRAKALNLIDSRRLMRDQFRQELVIAGTDIVVHSDDELFARRLVEIVDSELGKPSFNVTALADGLGLSRRQLTRRSKAVFGIPPSDLILQRRLERASNLLAARAGTVSEIAYQVGFKSSSHFGSAFRNVYGHSPSEHIKSGT